MSSNCVVSPEERSLLREKMLLGWSRRILNRYELPELDAEEVIKQALIGNGDDLSIGWSGGKCSTIVLHQVLKYAPNVKVLFQDTGIEFPENIEYVNEVKDLWNLNFYVIKPEITFWEIVKKYDFPKYRRLGSNIKRGKDNANSDRRPMCCWLLKEKPRYKWYRKMKISGDMNGIRASESRVRSIHCGMKGQIYLHKKNNILIYMPIAFWTKEMCETYLKENEIPYNKTYDTQQRNGCWPCTGYKGWEKNILRYSPKMYRFVQKLRGVNLMEDFLTVEDPPA